MTMADFAAEIAELEGSSESNNTIIYGDPGVGKTGLVASDPESLLLACDPGWVTAKRLGYKCARRLIPDARTLEAGIAWLEDGGYRNYRYVILDGMNILQTRLLQEFAREAYEINPEKRANAYQPDKPDYFRSQNTLKATVSRLCDIPVPVIFTAHTMHGEDNDGESWIRPHIEGREYQVGNFICGMVNVIGYMKKVPVKTGKETKQVRRILWQQFTDDNGVNYLAKDQTSALGFYTDDIDFSTFDAAICGEEKSVMTNGRRRK